MNLGHLWMYKRWWPRSVTYLRDATGKIVGATSPDQTFTFGTNSAAAPTSIAWANVTGKPSFFSGAYADLTGVPTLFDGKYSSLTGAPALFDGKYGSLTGLPALFDGKYTSLTGLPALFDGKYNSLTGLPTLFDGKYSSLTGAPTLFDGKYSSLTGKPELPRAAVLQTDSTGALTWTFSTPFATGVVPAVGITVQDASTGGLFDPRITAVDNKSVTIKLYKSASVTVAGVAVLGASVGTQATLHLTAIAPA